MPSFAGVVLTRAHLFGLVLIAALGCVAFIARQAVLSLKGRKSRLNGCGTCGGCGTGQPAQTKSTERIAFLPAEMLGRRR